MLGRRISDPDRSEEGGCADGLGYLDAETVFSREKRRARVCGRIGELSGTLAPLGGMEYEGYEIHMGRTEAEAGCFGIIKDHRTGMESADGAACGHIYGTYVHGVFDAPGVARRVVEVLAEHKGVKLQEQQEKTDTGAGQRAYKETQYDLLAENLRRHMDMEKIYEILEHGAAGRSAYLT
jgi:adenosylcobyric acid synthase